MMTRWPLGWTSHRPCSPAVSLSGLLVGAKRLYFWGKVASSHISQTLPALWDQVPALFQAALACPAGTCPSGGWLRFRASTEASELSSVGGPEGQGPPSERAAFWLCSRRPQGGMWFCMAQRVLLDCPRQQPAFGSESHLPVLLQEGSGGREGNGHSLQQQAGPNDT